MFRYKLVIEYDGSSFVGWQRQRNGLGVQQALEDASAKFCHHAIVVKGAGRTDAGVHALGQVCHLDFQRQWPTDTVRNAVNHYLRPLPVSVLAVERQDVDFDARFTAISRSYRYIISNRPARPALDRDRVWHVMRPLEHVKMAAAAKYLLGNHDFTTFRHSACQARSPVKTLDILDVKRQEDKVIIDVKARSFLHTQVRSMVGSLVMVGIGCWQPSYLKQILEARDRTKCAALAPPSGLYLVRVDY